MVSWADLQSTLTVSVALNAAYYTVSAFLNPTAVKQDGLISIASNAAAKIKDPQKQESFSDELAELRQQIVEIQYSGESVVIKFRIFAILFLYVGMVLLTISAIDPKSYAPEWCHWSSMVLNAPFLVAVFYVSAIESLKYKTVNKSRREIEKHMKIELESQRARGGKQ
jgi:hypothetical protein